jgi:hypothetical protein
MTSLNHSESAAGGAGFCSDLRNARVSATRVIVPHDQLVKIGSSWLTRILHELRWFRLYCIRFSMICGLSLKAQKQVPDSVFFVNVVITCSDDWYDQKEAA